MSDDIAEEYDRLIRPELYATADAFFRKAAREIDFPPLHVAVARRNATVKRHLGSHDQAVLQAAGFSLEELVAARTTKLLKRHAGRRLAMGAANVEQRRTALLAIREADQAALGWGEAIEAVQLATRAAHDREHDRKTLDSWLRVLHEWGLIGIKPPAARGRGRPRKKE